MPVDNGQQIETGLGAPQWRLPSISVLRMDSKIGMSDRTHGGEYYLNQHELNGNRISSSQEQKEVKKGEASSLNECVKRKFK
jgi:hypothetical protein